MISNNKLSYLLVDGDVWVGELGYDSRSYVVGGKFVPVGYSLGYADRRMGRGEVVPRGDVRRFIEALPIGTEIVAPEYSGCHYVGSVSYRKVDGGWEGCRCI